MVEGAGVDFAGLCADDHRSVAGSGVERLPGQRAAQRVAQLLGCAAGEDRTGVERLEVVGAIAACCDRRPASEDGFERCDHADHEHEQQEERAEEDADAAERELGRLLSRTE
jgi:hypothetical protein